MTVAEVFDLMKNDSNMAYCVVRNSESLYDTCQY